MRVCRLDPNVNRCWCFLDPAMNNRKFCFAFAASTDDDKIVKYQWEIVSGPLIDNSAQEANMDRPMLVLKGLSPGDYKFK